MKIPFLNRLLNPAPHVAVIRLQGVIGMASRGGGMTDAGLAPVLERAFKRKKPVAVALAVNSPGGSPVQSSLIGARIRRLSEERKVPVHAFVEDVADVTTGDRITKGENLFHFYSKEIATAGAGGGRSSSTVSA